MPSVNAEIKRLLREKDANIATAAEGIKGLLIEVKRQIVEELQAVKAESYTTFFLKQNLTSIERYLAGFESAAGQSLREMIDAAWQAGSEMVPGAARVSGLYVGFGHIPGPVLQAIKDISVYRIDSLTSAAFDKVRGELTLGVLGQKTPWEVMKKIEGSLDGPSIFKSLEDRAETITLLEMGRTYSAATAQGLVEAAAYVPELKKQWWHAGHPKRPRISHLAAHGQVRPVDEKFQVGVRKIDYPRAPDLPAEEVIRCA